MRIIFLCDTSRFSDVYAQPVRAQLCDMGADARVYTSQDILSHPDDFLDVTDIFSTWGMPRLTEPEIRRCLPALRCVYYGAGSVQAFARPYMQCGVRVFSAWGANGVPVAEYTVSQIILANTGFFAKAALQSAGLLEQAKAVKGFPGNYGAKVGLIGFGMIGKLVAGMLKAYRLEVLAFDPFASQAAADAYQARLTSLEEIFATCQVVSNHLANNPQTKGMLCGRLFDTMVPNATFINTGRGAQVDEADLIATLKRRPDIFALLDVTMPEPPVEGSEFYALPNVLLTPHIAGSKGDEVHRMAEYMLEEFLRVRAGETPKWEVSMKMLETMA